MKKYIALVAAAFVLAFASVAAAGQYAPAHWWVKDEGARSSYGWMVSNNFNTYTAADTTVTFIDNVTYNWHGTRRQVTTRNIAYYDPGAPYNGYARAAYCKFHTDYSVSGTCWY